MRRRQSLEEIHQHAVKRGVNKVHFLVNGRPNCGIDARWPSCLIASIKNPAKVTCVRCARAAQEE